MGKVLAERALKHKRMHIKNFIIIIGIFYDKIFIIKIEKQRIVVDSLFSSIEEKGVIPYDSIRNHNVNVTVRCVYHWVYHLDYSYNQINYKKIAILFLPVDG